MFQKIYTIFRIYKISDQLQFTQCSFRFITEFLTKQGTKSKTGTCFCCTIIMLYRINYYIYYIQMNIRKRCITNYSKTNTTRNCVHKFDNFFRLQNNFLISPGPADRLTIYDSSVTGAARENNRNYLFRSLSIKNGFSNQLLHFSMQWKLRCRLLDVTSQ